MGLQEGLMLLGAAVFILVLIDAIRRKRAAARREKDDYEDPEEIERRAQLARELPTLNVDGKKPASQKGLDPLFDDIDIFDDDPIPVLRNKQQLPEENSQLNTTQASELDEQPKAAITEKGPIVDEPTSIKPKTYRSEEEEELAWDKMRRKFSVDPTFAEASRSSMELQQKELQQLKEQKIDLAKQKQEQARFEENDNLDDLVELEHPKIKQPPKEATEKAKEQPETVAEIDPEEKEQNLRTALLTSLEKSAWGGSEKFLTINVNAPEDKAIVGSHLRYLMDKIGMKLSESGFYHYVEEQDAQSFLGYSLVNMFSPGNFDPNTTEEFLTTGIVLVMPLPNTPQPMAVFERMLATAKVMEESWGAELQDEQRSNLTQQTIEHYRQTIKDFEYQKRVNAKKAKRAGS
ncbi:cell division protein ZipA C-terminal FtsZ-binding domain-containing protein [Marinospirillum insulare]|uniref:Cell division protein ZipA n=1 Tax=Marinospirillum insulare TaxID=217169 RepID=A0ABQ5ZXY7_9GAMM|nr:cell division protein ZipA C-terminal FtsZ-binding domain-containing protein [Marinospirillum insulare]GLR63885.1 hypothetical protein GCM10007878_13220 [Marinospirillum insulare]